jgi:hypothetical protein
MIQATSIERLRPVPEHLTQGGLRRLMFHVKTPIRRDLIRGCQRHALALSLTRPTRRAAPSPLSDRAITTAPVPTPAGLKPLNAGHARWFHSHGQAAAPLTSNLVSVGESATGAGAGVGEVQSCRRSLASTSAGKGLDARRRRTSQAFSSVDPAGTWAWRPGSAAAVRQGAVALALPRAEAAEQRAPIRKW